MKPTCKEMAERANDRLDGRLGLLARLAFDRHAARCDGCRAHLRELEILRSTLRRLPPPELPASLSEGLLARFDAFVEEGRVSSLEPPPPGRRRLAPWPAIAALGVAAVLVASGRRPSHAPEDVAIALGLAAAALALAAVARRFGPRLAALGAAASVVAALASGRGGALDAAEGVRCLALELAGAAVVGAIAWWGERAEGGAAARRALAGGAVGGALAADAGLQIVCGAHLALAHLAAFHVLGVLVAAAWAARLGRAGRALPRVASA